LGLEAIEGCRPVDKRSFEGVDEADARRKDSRQVGAPTFEHLAERFIVEKRPKPHPFAFVVEHVISQGKSPKTG
jgi:hypothetical protein